MPAGVSGLRHGRGAAAILLAIRVPPPFMRGAWARLAGMAPWRWLRWIVIAFITPATLAGDGGVVAGPVGTRLLNGDNRTGGLNA